MLFSLDPCKGTSTQFFHFPEKRELTYSINREKDIQNKNVQGIVYSRTRGCPEWLMEMLRLTSSAFALDMFKPFPTVTQQLNALIINSFIFQYQHDTLFLFFVVFFNQSQIYPLQSQQYAPPQNILKANFTSTTNLNILLNLFILTNYRTYITKRISQSSCIFLHILVAEKKKTNQPTTHPPNSKLR